MNLVKMQGCGNDFLLFDCMHDDPPKLTRREIQYICDRHFGIGADGLVILRPSESANIAWTFYNCDGSEAEMCGNAARCVIRYVSDKYRPKQTPISLETKAGVIRGKMTEDGRVEITLLSKGDQKFEYQQMTIKSERSIFDVYFINTGVPHAVVEVKDIHTYPILQVGALLLPHPAFGPAGTNVTFYQRVLGSRIYSTTYERGVEHETYACGTGVAAAAIIFSERYMQPFPVDVAVPGGEMQVDISPVSKLLLLRGSAEYVTHIELNHLPSDYDQPRLYSRRRETQ